MREAAFDVAYSLRGDVAEAEDYANDVVARVRRSRRRNAALGAAAFILFALASAVAVARTDGATQRIVRTAAPAPTVASVEQPITTTTTAVLLQPGIPALAPVASPTTTATTAVRPVPPTTATTVQPAKGAVGPSAVVNEVWPPNRAPQRVYVAARGRDAAAHISRMTIEWGDGTATANFDYPLSACQAGDLEAADANHAYSGPGSYTVRLIVVTVGCDGSDGRKAIAETTVNYPSSPPG